MVGEIVKDQTSSEGNSDSRIQSLDFYLIKTDSEGNVEWERTLSRIYLQSYSVHTEGDETIVQMTWVVTADYAFSIQQTTDGGYIVVGKTVDWDGDRDVYLVKTDSKGIPVWGKTFGETFEDVGFSVQQTVDGGYIVAGEALPWDYGATLYLVKADSYGNKLWDKIFYESGVPVGLSIQQTIDGGYIIAASSLVKTDHQGNILWKKAIDWGFYGYAVQSVRQTADTGYIMVGGGSVIKTDHQGEIVWKKPLSVAGWMWGGDPVQQTRDGGYIVTGGIYLGNYPDIYLVKLGSLDLVNNPPIADANGPYVGNEGSPLTFDASNSTDPDGDALQYRWDFDNDGTWDTGWSSSPTATYTWCDDWSGTAKLEVSDGELTATDTASVTVDNVPPTPYWGSHSVDGVYPAPPYPEGLDIFFDSTVVDPGTCDTFTYDWDFGDGTALLNAGTPVTHAWGDNGVYTVTLTVTDDDGGVGIDNVPPITISNVPPAVEAGSDQIVDEGDTVSFSGNFTDLSIFKEKLALLFAFDIKCHYGTEEKAYTPFKYRREEILRAKDSFWQGRKGDSESSGDFAQQPRI
ncbi:MAG: PKD domain-containing protein [archaeon]|nr:PKD domain-containing protein [archaeon]